MSNHQNKAMKTKERKMKESLLEKLLETQARSLTPVAISKSVKLVGFAKTNAGPEKIATDPDEIGFAKPHNFLAAYAVEGHEHVVVVVSLVPVGDHWEVYPETPYSEIADQAEKSPKSEPMPWGTQ